VRDVLHGENLAILLGLLVLRPERGVGLKKRDSFLSIVKWIVSLIKKGDLLLRQVKQNLNMKTKAASYRVQI
jgi:hypothetical protein